MKETLKHVKDILSEFFSYLHLYDIALFSAFLLLSMCFIFLSFIAFRRKLLCIPLFIIGFAIAIAIPFAMRYLMEERFYKIEVDETYNRIYNYSDVYQYIAKVKNVGKRNIYGCIISHRILYDTSKDSSMIEKYRHLLLNYVKPKQVYNTDVKLDLKVGQTVELNKLIEDYPHRGEKYTTKIECYGKSRYADGDKILRGVYEPKNKTSEDSKQNNAEQENVDDLVDDVSGNVDDTLEDTSTEQQDSVTQTTEENISNDNTTQENTQEQNNTSTAQERSEEQNSEEKSSNNEAQSSQQNNNEQTLDADWREKRDNFTVPLLKETPR